MQVRPTGARFSRPLISVILSLTLLLLANDNNNNNNNNNNDDDRRRPSFGVGVGLAGARSIWSLVPGGELVRELSRGLIETVDSALDSALGSAIKRASEDIPPIVNGCLNELECAPDDPDARRNVSEIIRSRGFLAEEHQVETRDGYLLIIQRIVNPLVEPDKRAQLKPVILQHGLMSSSVDWVINSVDVRPAELVAKPEGAASGGRHSGQQTLAEDSQEHPNSLGFYLANQGYDVFLANSRGNIYGQRHVSLSSWNPKFWDFTFDEQIKYDLPDTIQFVQRLTNHTKVGYVGHSQGTTMILGLLADQPDYADVVEPVVLLAPVAYVNNCLSPVRHFAVYTPLAAHINMWFGSSNAAVRYLAPLVCGPQVIRRDICANIIFLSTGFDEAQFNETRVKAYLAHMPSGTSVKNIAHWGQEVQSGRFAHFDHGLLGNQITYNSTQPPAYELAKIRSQSLAIFAADNDWLASPKDVARLLAELQVKPAMFVNATEQNAKWNHIDFLYGKDCGQIINTKVVELFKRYDQH